MRVKRLEVLVLLNMKMTGDWNRAGVHLKNVSKQLTPLMQATLYESGEYTLEKMKEHIINQDLSWVPLSSRTIELKGNDTIMVETGRLLNDGLVVRRIKSSVKGSTIFVGASPWKKHSGIKMSDLMIWLEYGTDSIPPRPLIRPTYDEVIPFLKKNWGIVIKELVEGGK